MAAIVEVPHHIALALSLASSATGVDYDYLVQTASRESSFKPTAAARTSSARGLFQFIEETWLHSIKEDGPRFGLGHLAEHITKTPRGRYRVTNRDIRRQILALRDDPKIASVMAAAYTRRNADMLADGLGRSPTPGELYVAHFLGAGDAVRLIRLMRNSPNVRADTHFRAAARANRSIFYRNGQPRSVRDVYRVLVRNYDARRRASPRSTRSWSTTVVRGGQTRAPIHRAALNGSSSVQALLREAADRRVTIKPSHVRSVGQQQATEAKHWRTRSTPARATRNEPTRRAASPTAAAPRIALAAQSGNGAHVLRGAMLDDGAGLVLGLRSLVGIAD